MPSIADTATKLAAAGVPVLFLDTCSILDVIRAPVRSLAGCAEAASELLAMATTAAPLCNLVVGSFVPTEWDDHDESVLNTLIAHFDRMDEHANHFHQLCRHLGIGLGFTQPQYTASGLANSLRDLAHQLLLVAVPLDPHPDTMTRAYNRVIMKRRPCRKSSELKDCTIFEECLEVCRHLQAASFSRKLIFCSSNTDDYCAPGLTPHAEVGTDCGAVGLRFTTTLPWAVSELKT